MSDGRAAGRLQIQIQVKRPRSYPNQIPKKLSKQLEALFETVFVTDSHQAKLELTHFVPTWKTRLIGRRTDTVRGEGAHQTPIERELLGRLRGHLERLTLARYKTSQNWKPTWFIKIIQLNSGRTWILKRNVPLELQKCELSMWQIHRHDVISVPDPLNSKRRRTGSSLLLDRKHKHSRRPSSWLRLHR